MAREKRVYFLRSGNLTEKSRSKDSKLEILIWKTTIVRTFASRKLDDRESEESFDENSTQRRIGGNNRVILYMVYT